MKKVEEVKHVFVYGTLKQGGRLNSNMGEAKMLSEGSIDNFAMYNASGWYPGIKDKKGEKVHGELFEIPDERLMTRLDMVEGAPFLFSRRVVDVSTSEGTHKAFTYIYNGHVDDSQLVGGGRWNVKQ